MGLVLMVMLVVVEKGPEVGEEKPEGVEGVEPDDEDADEADEGATDDEREDDSEAEGAGDLELGDAMVEVIDIVKTECGVLCWGTDRRPSRGKMRLPLGARIMIWSSSKCSRRACRSDRRVPQQKKSEH